MDLTAIVSNIGTAYTIAKGLVDIRDGQKLASVQVDLTERLLKAQTHIAELLGMVTEKTVIAGELQERVRELESHQSERDRYELAEIAVGCAAAYRLKDPSALRERTGEPPHFLCQPCLDVRRNKVVLVMNNVFGTETFTCPECKAVISGKHVGM